MTKEEVIEKCREAIEVNKHVRETTNNALSHAIGLLDKYVDGYEHGANEALELARKIGCHPINGGWDSDELELIFDTYSSNSVFDNYTYQEALAKVKEYEKKKEEEAAKPKLGDVVEVIDKYGGFTEKGIFLAMLDNSFTYIATNRMVVEAKRDYFEINKTGEHVDIRGMLDKIGG